MRRWRRRRLFAWAGVLALLVQLFVPLVHDLHDLAGAFATAAVEESSPSHAVRSALAALDRHHHGTLLHAAGRGANRHPSGDGSDGRPKLPPCPIWQAAHVGANCLAVAFDLPLPQQPPAAILLPIRGAAAATQADFVHRQSRAPPLQA